jgi:hypothetical protein
MRESEITFYIPEGRRYNNDGSWGPWERLNPGSLYEEQGDASDVALRFVKGGAPYCPVYAFTYAWDREGRVRGWTGTPDKEASNA